MHLFFYNQPVKTTAIVDKTNVTFLQSPPVPPFNVVQWTTDAGKDRIFH